MTRSCAEALARELSADGWTAQHYRVSVAVAITGTYAVACTDRGLGDCYQYLVTRDSATVISLLQSLHADRRGY